MNTDTSHFIEFKNIAGKIEFIEVRKWTNGEGFDLSLSDRRQFNFTWDEYDAMKKALIALGQEDDSSDLRSKLIDFLESV
jgi:hypothetical protein